MDMRTHPASGFYSAEFKRGFFLPRYWPTWLALGLLRLSVYIPWRVRAFFSAPLGDLYYYLNAKRRRIAEVNIALCFPAWSAEARYALVRRHFRAAMQAALDLAWFWWATQAELDKHIYVTGLEHYQAQHERGGNVILLTCHSIALEVGGPFLSRFFPMISLIKPARNELVNWFMTKSRTRAGGRLFVRAHGLRPIIRSIKQGMGFYYVPDEDLGLKESVFAPFFGVPAATLAALGRMAELADAVVIPFFTRMLIDRKGYELILCPPLDNFPSGDMLADATRMNQELEKGILKMPEQYMWTFKRFKNRPDNAPSPYEKP
jgi:lipid A biosynthesis lauroyl/palmitoleoyl acyltransferase